MSYRGWRTAALLLSASVHAMYGADDPALAQILQRLDALERENTKLRDEVRELRSRLDGQGAAPVEERLAVQERRIEEHAQTKVESSERVPVKLTGMLVFNVYSAGRNGTPVGYPTIANQRPGPAETRGTMRQTSIGLDVESPITILGAHARGEVMMDFYGFYEQYPVPRIRTGFLDLNWNTRSLRFGLEKPIVAPRSPTSLAQIIYPALWGAGNLWLWQPQMRLEQRFKAGGLDIAAQAGILQTNEFRVLNVDNTLQPRPAWQGRLQLGKQTASGHTFEIAPGFHYSRTLIEGVSAPSQLFTADWLASPSKWWDVSGALFHGRNAAPIGGLRQGVVIRGPGNVGSVGTTGGWTQLALKPLDRLRFHGMFGLQDDVNRHLRAGQIGRNLSWAVNSIFQISPNVLLGLELQQIRTNYIGARTQVLNRYDLGLAYLF